MTGTRCALVIDDDEICRLAISKQLHTLGFDSVTDAGDGTAARRALDGPQRFELIVLDLHLPDHDAVELMRALPPRQEKADIVLISAREEAVLRSVAVLCRGRGQRVIGAFRKPLGTQMLADLLERKQSASATRAPGRAADRDDLARALDLRIIGARVQPKIPAADKSLYGVEVLAHWDDPQRGVVSPSHLAQIAGEPQSVGRFTEYTVGQALRLCADWRRQHLQVPVSLNLAPLALRDLDLPDRTSGIDAGQGDPAAVAAA